MNSPLVSVVLLEVGHQQREGQFFFDLGKSHIDHIFVAQNLVKLVQVSQVSFDLLLQQEGYHEVVQDSDLLQLVLVCFVGTNSGLDVFGHMIVQF